MCWGVGEVKGDVGKCWGPTPTPSAISPMHNAVISAIRPSPTGILLLLA